MFVVKLKKEFPVAGDFEDIFLATEATTIGPKHYKIHSALENLNGLVIHASRLIVIGRVGEAKCERTIRLPLEIAEALERAKNMCGGDPELVSWWIPRRDYHHVWKTLHNFSCKRGNFFKLIDALRYGYTIETNPKEKLENDLVEIIGQWMHEQPSGDYDEKEDYRILARRIVERLGQEKEKSG